MIDISSALKMDLFLFLSTTGHVVYVGKLELLT